MKPQRRKEPRTAGARRTHLPLIEEPPRGMDGDETDILQGPDQLGKM